MTLSFFGIDNTSNYSNDSIVSLRIDIKNYKYIPLYIHRIIQVCIISNILSRDIYLLLVQELYKLYRWSLTSYEPPMLLTMSHTQCVYCNKKLKNTIYSKLIDLHYGWNHCYNCDDLIKKWYYHYIESNFILPFDYIDNIDIDIDYYRTRTQSIHSANVNIFKKYIIFNKSTQKILVPVYWIENEQHFEKWIPLINILYYTDTIKLINYRIPMYWSIYTKDCWETFLDNTYTTVNSLHKLNTNEIIEYFTD